MICTFDNSMPQFNQELLYPPNELIEFFHEIWLNFPFDDYEVMTSFLSVILDQPIQMSKIDESSENIKLLYYFFNNMLNPSISNTYKKLEQLNSSVLTLQNKRGLSKKVSGNLNFLKAQLIFFKNLYKKYFSFQVISHYQQILEKPNLIQSWEDIDFYRFLTSEIDISDYLKDLFGFSTLNDLLTSQFVFYDQSFNVYDQSLRDGSNFHDKFAKETVRKVSSNNYESVSSLYNHLYILTHEDINVTTLRGHYIELNKKLNNRWNYIRKLEKKEEL